MQKKTSVLVVDRAFMVAETLAATLEKHGYNAFSETDFTGALRELDAVPAPDLLIAHGGAEHDAGALAFLFFALKEHPRLPVVIITGLPFNEVKLAPGRWVYLQKPFDSEALLSAMSAASALIGSTQHGDELPALADASAP